MADPAGSGTVGAIEVAAGSQIIGPSGATGATPLEALAVVGPQAAAPTYGKATPRIAQVDVSHLKAVKSELLELMPKPDWSTATRDIGALALVAYRILCSGGQWHAPDQLETVILAVLVANAALAISKAMKARRPKNSLLLAFAHLEDSIEQVEPEDGKPLPERWKFLSRKKS